MSIPKLQNGNTRTYALSKHCQKCIYFFGNFLVTKKFAGLIQPPDFRPPFVLPPGAAPQVAHVWKTEEKGSDVNLGAHLVRDAALRVFDEAAVLTNDTDLVEPIRIVMQEFGLPVTLLTPSDKHQRPR